MNTVTVPKLTSVEISTLWAAYLTDSLAEKMIECFLKNVSDEDARKMLEAAYSISTRHLKSIKTIFDNEGLKLPAAFTEQDINPGAPRLYTDTYYMFYLGYLSRFGLTTFSMALYHTARSDVKEFYTGCITEILQFYNKLTDLMLEKGIFVRAPIIDVANEVDFVKSDSFFKGIFSEPRPLLAIEVANIFMNIMSNLIGKPLVTGFAQVAKDGEVREYLLKVKDMLDNHSEKFSSILKKEDIPVASSSDAMAIASTEAPYSDKLIMYHIIVVIGLAIKNYTDALVANMRTDIHAEFLQFSAQLAKVLAEGTGIMVKNGWFEQPPQAVQTKNLVGAGMS